MKVSVIIAAYNAEKYLVETLESVANQTIDDYEIIVVNDGSTDETAKILETYKNLYPHIVVIHKENGGPSSARNRGLDIAKGEFVYFFDADDVLELDALEALYEKAILEKADLVIAKYDIFNRFRTFPVNDLNSLVELDEIEKYETKILWTFSLCNKLFKRELIEENKLRLPPISYSEDGAFLMRYVYHTEKITGLDKVIFHYRRLFDEEDASITASVSPGKIRDYVEAHRLISEAAKESVLRDFKKYKTVEEAMEQDEEIHQYLNEINRKELQILINQFYAKFWSLEEDTIQLLKDEIESKLSCLDMQMISMLMDAHPEFSLFYLPVTRKDALMQAAFTVACYSEPDTADEFVTTLKSLTIQNLITMQIVLPAQMKSIVEREELSQDNIFYLDVAEKETFYYQALDFAKTPYITFTDSKIAYADNAFKYAFKNFIKSSADFIVELVYHRNYGDAQTVLLNQAALNSVKGGYEYNDTLAMDHLLGNKFFKTEYVKSLQPDRSKSLVSQLERLYRTSYFVFMNDRVVFYEDKEDTFADYVSTPETEGFIEEFMKDKHVSLSDETMDLEPEKVLPKLSRFPSNKLSKVIFRKMVSFLRRRPLKDQVLFFSIRKNGELEGNAKALYPYVNGKKKICAKQLPHKRLTELKMYYHTFTSKVIVTDDYDRYLRHYPLRKNQRVIQLWHACGAFKKFGQRGTNISIFLDNETHAQYNLVSVSGDRIRPIYADAFNVELERVKALGVPRTDAFYDEERMEVIREKVYQAYPEWKQKDIIVYAPTFRDADGKRNEFIPELDFEQLSKDLLPNQIFVICPHPVMQNKIVEGEYDNIKVVRDFSTNDIMLVSSMLITDYSSVIFEYALLKKPIAFFCYDLPIYNRGFYLDYPEDLPGDVYETQETLTAFLRDTKQHCITEKYHRFVEKYMSACDGHSCERIAKLINDYMEERKDV